MSNEALVDMEERLRLLAESSIGQRVWPFVVLDWFRFRDESITSRAHVEDLVEMLLGSGEGIDGLRPLLATCAELLGPDGPQIADVLGEYLGRSSIEVPLEIEPDLFADMRSAGLSLRAIKRLGLRDRSPSSQAQTIGGTPMTAFISYSHEGEEPDGPWMTLVRKFAKALTDNGIAVELDQWGEHLNRDWSIWGPSAVDRADIVLCLASPDYRNKWMASSGSGAADEARTIRSKRATGKKVSFVVLPDRSDADIPDDMAAFHRYNVPAVTDSGLEELIRALTGQPRFPPPKLGSVPKLPADE